jgi:hypothetical protein
MIKTKSQEGGRLEADGRLVLSVLMDSSLLIICGISRRKEIFIQSGHFRMYATLPLVQR